LEKRLPGRANWTIRATRVRDREVRKPKPGCGRDRARRRRPARREHVPPSDARWARPRFQQGRIGARRASRPRHRGPGYGTPARGAWYGTP